MQLPEDIIWKLIFSIIIGGLIGAEREYRSKSAGFVRWRWFVLALLCLQFFSELIGTKSSPDRIASNVVVRHWFCRRRRDL